MKKQSFRSFLFIKLVFTACLASVLPSASHAATSDWAATKGGRMRLVALPQRSDGMLPAILQIELEKGWKTYWREPGSAGIPPQVTIADGGNVSFSRLRFPVPKIFDDGKTRDYGYEGSVSLVLNLKQLQPEIPARLDAQIFLGLCEKICVPFQAELSVMTDAKDPVISSEAGLVAQAEMRLPEEASEDFRIEKATVSPSGTEITVKTMLPDLKSIEGATFLATNSDGVSFETAQILSVSGRFVSVGFKLHNGAHGYSVKDKPVQILVIAGDRAMETTLAFE